MARLVFRCDIKDDVKEIVNHYKDEELVFMSSSEIEDIKTFDDHSDLIVVGYKAEEIATSIKVKKFIEQNEISIRDLLNFSRKVVSSG